MNKILLVGRFTRDPETRYSQSAEPLAITRFSIAVNRRFKRGGEADADFINCVAFGKSGEFIQRYFVKGMQIGISGRLQIRNWEDSQGQRKTTAEVIVEESEFVEKKSANNSYRENNSFAPAPQPRSNTYNNNSNSGGDDGFYQVEDSVDPDDLPF
ncbi:MAG: single-stranded DNA-binding protein [Clostridiales bacterium]|nr:single-stranded DNA-binding protein [Clostridiales bacterium]